MGPKPDPDEIKYIVMKVVGGEVTSAAALAPKCSPLGLSPKVVGEAIQKATKEWKGVKIMVEIAVQNRQCTVKTLPSATPKIIKALKKVGRDRKKQKEWKYNADMKFDDVLAIAKEMREAERSLAIKLEGTVREILGTCVSLGCTVDKKSPKAVSEEVKKGERKCQ